MMLQQSLEHRLKTLKTEFESGKQVLAELEAKQANVRETLLRISGAMQVLEELLSEVEPDEQPNGTGPESDVIQDKFISTHPL